MSFKGFFPPHSALQVTPDLLHHLPEPWLRCLFGWIWPWSSFHITYQISSTFNIQIPTLFFILVCQCQEPPALLTDFFSNGTGQAGCPIQYIGFDNNNIITRTHNTRGSFWVARLVSLVLCPRRWVLFRSIKYRYKVSSGKGCSFSPWIRWSGFWNFWFSYISPPLITRLKRSAHMLITFLHSVAMVSSYNYCRRRDFSEIHPLHFFLKKN